MHHRPAEIEKNANATPQSIRLPCGTTVWYTLTRDVNTLNGAMWDDLCLEIDSATRNGRSIPADDPKLLADLMQALNWDAF